MSAGKKKPSKANKSHIERFAAPDADSFDSSDQNYLFKCALKNEYQQFCGAFDACTKDMHPLASFIAENNLFNKRDHYYKSAFDLACLVGNKEFLKAVLERTNEKEKLNDENILNLREFLKSSKYALNYMHYACIWNRLDVVKFLVEQDKLILDPDLNDSDSLSMGASAAQLSSVSPSTQQGNNSKNNQNANMKTLGCILLRSKNKYGETPKDLAERYKHDDLVAYLSFAEKRQNFVDFVNDIKSFMNDPERHQNKLNKEDKKKLEKIFSETLVWLEKNKELYDAKSLEEKVVDVKTEVKSIYDRVHTLIIAAGEKENQLNASTTRSRASIEFLGYIFDKDF